MTSLRKLSAWALVAWAAAAVACGRDALDLPAGSEPLRDAAAGATGGSGGRGGAGGLDAAAPEKRDARTADAAPPSGSRLVVQPAVAVVPIAFPVKPSALRVNGAVTDDVTKATTWTIVSDTTTGAWDAAALTFTPKRAGVTQLRAAAEGLTATATITTIAAVPLDVVVNPGQAAIAIGARQAFTASIRYSEGSQSDATHLAAWSVRDPAVATVANDPVQRGSVTGAASGSTLVIATVLGGVTGQAQLTVEGMIAPTTLVISPSSPQRVIGGDVAFTAQATRSGKVENATDGAKWDSSNRNVASIAVNRATCLASGSTTITASYMGMVASTRLSCTQSAAKALALVVKPSELTVVSGAVYKLTAEATYAGGSTRDVTASAEWMSSASDVVSVSQGQLKVTKAGTATITATFDGLTASAVANALR